MTTLGQEPPLKLQITDFHKIKLPDGRYVPKVDTTVDVAYVCIEPKAVMRSVSSQKQFAVIHLVIEIQPD